jgi:hypothetical protein
MEGDQRDAQKFIQDRQNVQFKSGSKDTLLEKYCVRRIACGHGG